jgi:hypothetical protein
MYCGVGAVYKPLPNLMLINTSVPMMALANQAMVPNLLHVLHNIDSTQWRTASQTGHSGLVVMIPEIHTDQRQIGSTRAIQGNK